MTRSVTPSPFAKWRVGDDLDAEFLAGINDAVVLVKAVLERRPSKTVVRGTSIAVSQGENSYRKDSEHQQLRSHNDQSSTHHLDKVNLGND